MLHSTESFHGVASSSVDDIPPYTAVEIYLLGVDD